jgi:hypothetical protein
MTADDVATFMPPDKNSPGVAAGAEAVSFRRRKMIQVESHVQD